MSSVLNSVRNGRGGGGGGGEGLRTRLTPKMN